MNWIPLVEYASQKKISISTLRRRIKLQKITFKIENGKYLILDESFSPWNSDQAQLLETIRTLKEENAELKTLIATYEELVK